MAQFARLPHKATGQHGAVIDMRTAGDDEVVTNHSMTDIDRRLLAAVDAAVSQSARARYGRIVAHAYIFNCTAIHQGDVCTQRTAVGGMFVAVIIGNLLHPCRQLWAVAIERHDVGLMGREFIVHRDLSPTRFIEHSHLHAITEARHTVHQEQIDMLNTGMVTNLVVGNVVLHMLNAAIIAYGDVMKGNMTDTGVLLHPTGKREGIIKGAQAHLTAKVYMVHIVGAEILRHQHLIPILCMAHLCLQLLQLSTIQSSHFF